MSSGKDPNDGVHSVTGYTFQIYAALYHFLENYNTFLGTTYFLCIEHHEDFLFCFYNTENEIQYIDAFQAKKSSDKWGMSADFFKLLNKLTETGIDLENDPITKTKDYYHNLHFCSNYSIELSINKTHAKVNETNITQSYRDLPIEIREKIEHELSRINANYSQLELEKTTLDFFDLGKSEKALKRQLIGSFAEVFGSSIPDHDAAITTLLELLRKNEHVFNQGNKAQLLDSKKRIDCREIENALDIINDKKKAYKLWREQGYELSKILAIKVAERTTFETSVANSFDLFKDLSQQEHQNILTSVRLNAHVLQDFISDSDCIQYLYQIQNKNGRSQLPETQIKAAVLAAYIIIRSENEQQNIL